jgi:hypothetical protein
MMMKRIIIFVLLLIGFSAWGDFSDFYYGVSEAFSGLADPNTGLTIFPTLLIPAGGRFEGMGTAFTAVSDDTGFIESNPAGSSSLEYTELSLLHHSWIADSNVEGIIWTTRLNDFGIGVGAKFLYIPFTEYNDWGERESKGYISESIATLNVSYNLFSSYYFYGLAFGANVKLAYRNIPSNIYPGQSTVSGMFDVGILTRFNLLKFFYARAKNFSVGIALKNIGVDYLGEPLPSRLSTGIAYSFFRPLLLSVDFNVPFSMNPDIPPERWYIATGADLVITNFLSLQAGFQIKENPRVSLGANVTLDNVDFVINYNLDLSGKINPLDKFSVKASLNLGDYGRKDRRQRAEEYYLRGLEEWAYGNLILAAEYFWKSYELDKKFIPAREYALATEKRIELIKRLEEEMKNIGGID